MANKNLDTFKKLISQDKSGWLEKANWRKENEEWLDVSFKIAIKIISALKMNRVKDVFPKNQKELSDALDCTPQYISKLLKGEERLGIDTISKIGNILGVKLIEVPNENVLVASVISNPTSALPQYSQVIESKGTSFLAYHFDQLMNEKNNLQSSYNKLIEASTYARDNNSHLKVA